MKQVIMCNWLGLISAILYVLEAAIAGAEFDSAESTDVNTLSKIPEIFSQNRNTENSRLTIQPVGDSNDVNNEETVLESSEIAVDFSNYDDNFSPYITTEAKKPLNILEDINPNVPLSRIANADSHEISEEIYVSPVDVQTSSEIKDFRSDNTDGTKENRFGEFTDSDYKIKPNYEYSDDETEKLYEDPTEISMEEIRNVDEINSDHGQTPSFPIELNAANSRRSGIDLAFLETKARNADHSYLGDDDDLEEIRLDERAGYPEYNSAPVIRPFGTPRFNGKLLYPAIIPTIIGPRMLYPPLMRALSVPTPAYFNSQHNRFLRDLNQWNSNEDVKDSFSTSNMYPYVPPLQN